MKHYRAKPLEQAVRWAQYCMSNINAASCSRESKCIHYSGVQGTRSKPQERTLHALHNVGHVVHAVLSCQQFIASTDSQEAHVPVCYDLWWTNGIVGSIAGHTPGNEEGGSDQQVMPELLNEAFSEKATQQKPWKHHKETL